MNESQFAAIQSLKTANAYLSALIKGNESLLKSLQPGCGTPTLHADLKQRSAELLDSIKVIAGKHPLPGLVQYMAEQCQQKG